MPHDPQNAYCHHPPRPCICDVIGARPGAPGDPSIAPALLEWWDAASGDASLDTRTAWRDARPYFEVLGVDHEFPRTPAGFADLLDYAEPLFRTRRSVTFDVSHAAADGTIDVIGADRSGDTGDTDGTDEIRPS